MLLAYEPLESAASAWKDGVRLLGIEAVPGPGAWPRMRHVFELDREAGLHVEIDPLGDPIVYAVGYDLAGEETLTPL